MFTYPEPKSPFKPSEFNPTTLKAAANPAVEDAMYKFSNHPTDLFDGMAQENLAPTNTGKKIFVDLMNQSSSQNMYPMEATPEDTQELFHRRHTFDFANKSKVQYVPPPVSKDI